MDYGSSTSHRGQGRSNAAVAYPGAALLLCWGASAALALAALLPALAQAGKGSTGEELEVSAYSEQTNSLCTRPTGATFASPGTEFSPTFGPLESSDSPGEAFPDTGSACAEPALKNPITEGGERGGESGFKYGSRPLYESRIPGAEWVTAYAGAESGPAPAYYIYDAEFHTPVHGQSRAEGAVRRRQRGGRIPERPLDRAGRDG